MPEEAVTEVQAAEPEAAEEPTLTEGEQEPEPAPEGGGGEAEAEGEASGEQAGGEAEGTDDDWLPTEQEKEFPLDVLTKFAEKRHFEFSAEEIAAKPGVQRMLKDMLNKDIYIRSLEQQTQGEEEETDELDSILDGDEPELEGEEAEAELQPQGTAQQLDARAQHYQRVEALVNRFDPQATEELGKNLLSAFGVNLDQKYISGLQAKLRDGNTTPAQRAEIQSYLDTAGGASRVGQTLAKGALDLVLTVLPDVLPEVIEQVFPGSQDNYKIGVVSRTWENLRATTGKDGKPLVANLPAWGTKEFSALVQKTEKILGIPRGGLQDFNRFDGQGRMMPFAEHAKYITRMIAKVSRGQNPSPKVVSDALQTGAQKAREQNQRRAQGRALGSGQPTSTHGAPTGNEDIFGPGIEEYRRRGG